MIHTHDNATLPEWRGRGWQFRFIVIWLGQAISMVGSALVQFALIWYLTEKTGSEIILTYSTLTSMAPFAILGPFAGALVDRWKRRWVMVVADVLIALATAVLALLFYLEVAQVWHVFLILFVRAFGDVFQMPALRASTSLMVPKEQLTRVGGMNELLQGVVSIISPLLGAFVLEWLDMQGTLALDVVTAVLAITPLLLIRIPEPPRSKTQPHVLREMAVGWRYLTVNRGLLAMFVTLALMRFFTAPAFSLLPLIVTKDFGGSKQELAWMSSSHGVGFILGGIILSVWGGFKKRTDTIIMAFIGLAILSTAFSLVPTSLFNVALIVMFMRTGMVPFIRSSIMAIFQTYVPHELQGRVFTLMISVMTLAAPVSLLIAGPLAQQIGSRSMFTIAGAGLGIISIVWAVAPRLRTLEADLVKNHASPVAD